MQCATQVKHDRSTKDGPQKSNAAIKTALLKNSVVIFLSITGFI